MLHKLSLLMTGLILMMGVAWLAIERFTVNRPVAEAAVSTPDLDGETGEKTLREAVIEAAADAAVARAAEEIGLDLDAKPFSGRQDGREDSFRRAADSGERQERGQARAEVRAQGRAQAHAEVRNQSCSQACAQTRRRRARGEAGSARA
ncbi:MAG: hypothetical protein R3C52_14510 [Hyphomonadaceae bacterium]